RAHRERPRAARAHRRAHPFRRGRPGGARDHRRGLRLRGGGVMPRASLLRDERVIGAVAMFLLLAVVYSASLGLRATRGASITADEPFYLMTTQSLIDDGDLDLRQQYE